MTYGNNLYFICRMGRPLPTKQPPSKRQTAPSRAKTPRATTKRSTGRKKKKKEPPKNLVRDFALITMEWFGLMISCMAAIILLLGHFGNRFSGTDMLSSLLPFAGGIFGFILLTTLLLSGWMKVRKWLRNVSPYIPSTIVVGLTIVAATLVPQGLFTQAFGYYRTLVGGKEEAGRVTLAHQVFAAYRRMPTGQLEMMLTRAEPFAQDIEDAAEEFDINVNILKGLAAAESSYLPRKSSDGGHGLFQITRAPAAVTQDMNKRFQADSRDMYNARYNAFTGAATLRYYLSQMNDDLFLGLLAYNIGPANGGLRFIMQQYGATDFITIQPYLKQLPRDYPIRVLSYALAFRIQQKKGKLLAYEEENNALIIQSLGVPGL
jgi:hypothetical protein